MHLDAGPQTGNFYKYIFSASVQRCDAVIYIYIYAYIYIYINSIDFQCGVHFMMHLFESKMLAYDQTDRHKITKGPRTTRQTDGRKYYAATYSWPSSSQRIS